MPIPFSKQTSSFLTLLTTLYFCDTFAITYSTWLLMHFTWLPISSNNLHFPVSFIWGTCCPLWRCFPKNNSELRKRFLLTSVRNRNNFIQWNRISDGVSDKLVRVSACLGFICVSLIYVGTWPVQPNSRMQERTPDDIAAAAANATFQRTQLN